MVIKIHQACSTPNALYYNERKVVQHKATFYHSRNTPEINPFLGDKNARHRIFKEIEDRNTRVQKEGLHISVNPTVGDLVRLGDTGIRTEIDNLMKQFGYGNQPYLVYKQQHREFVGARWIKYLNEQQIRYYIRIRENFWVLQPHNGNRVKASWLCLTEGDKQFL